MECEYVVSHKSKNETSSLARGSLRLWGCGAGGFLAMKTNAKSLKATKALPGKVEIRKNSIVSQDAVYSISRKVNQANKEEPSPIN